MTVILGIAGIVFGLGMLVTIHEFGHFIVAKLVGVRVLAFSLGFGPYYIFRRKWGDTEYRIGFIPLGGFVQMLGQEDLKVEDGEAIEPDNYNAKSVWQRMAIIVAGPVFNLILAAILFFFVYSTGVTFPAGPFVGKPDQKTPAIFHARTGIDENGEPTGKSIKIPIGSEIIEVEGRRLKSFVEMQMTVAYGPANTWVKVKYRATPDADIDTAYVKTEINPNIGVPTIGPFRPDVKYEYYQFGARTRNRMIVTMLISNGEACLKGLRIGDMPLAVRAANAQDIQRMNLSESDVPAWLKPGRSDIKPYFDPDRQDILARLAVLSGVMPIVNAAMPDHTLASLSETADAPRVTAWVDLPSDEYSFRELVVGRQGAPLIMKVEKADTGNIVDYLLFPRKQEPDTSDKNASGNDDKPLYLIGAAVPEVQMVTQVDPDSPASKAGITPGQIIVDVKKRRGRLNVTVVPPYRYDPDESAKQSRKLSKQWRVSQDVIKSAKTVTIDTFTELDPVKGEVAYQAGGMILKAPVMRDSYINETILGAVKLAARDTLVYGSFPLTLIRKLISGKSKMKRSAVSGPVGIGSLIFQISEQRKLSYYFWWMAFLSIQLGVLNLLPIPILDGGHIFMLLWEAVARKPLPVKVQTALLYMGLFLLASLFLFATFNDFVNIFKS